MKHQNYLSRLTAHGSRLTAHGSRLTAHGSRLICLVIMLLTSIVLSSQPNSSSCNGGFLPGSPPIGDCSLTINIEFVMMIDQALVDKYGGNLSTARNKAEELFYHMSELLSEEIYKVGGFDVQMHLIYFPNDIVPNNWKTGGWSYGGFLSSSARRCIKYDGRIILTNQDLGIDGFQSGGPLCYLDETTFQVGASVRFGESAAEMTLAHEILHGLNLNHIDDLVTNSNGDKVYSTTCGNLCDINDKAPLMCKDGADKYRITACDLICLKKLFDAPRCECLSRIYPGYYSEFTCDELPKVTLATNQMYLVKGCDNKRNRLDFMVVLDGSLNGVSNANFRVKFNKGVYDWISTSGDFDTEVSVDNFYNELVLTVNNDPNGIEESISLQQDEEKILHFSLLYNPDIVDATINNGKTLVVGRLFNSQISISGSKQPKACIPISGTVNILPASDPVIVTSDLFIVGTDLTIGVTTPLILVDNGASISLSNAHLKFFPSSHTVVEGCSTMWKGFDVPFGNILELNNTMVKDASNGVNLHGGGSLYATNTAFFNNIIGVKSIGNNTLELKGNLFSTSPSGIKPPFLGQVPTPTTIGFAGVFITGSSTELNIQKDPNTGISNVFSNLYYGILAENTDVKVRAAIFDNIVKETKPTGYPGPFFTGSAIYLNGGNADVKGNFTGIVPDPLIMDNCYTGVNVFKGAISVAGCEMGHMTNGIIAGGGANKAYTVSWNNIAASDQGISVFYQSGLPGQSSIDNNTVHMAGNPNGIGIANGGQEMFPQQEGFVANNIVTVEEGATGIQIGVANRIKVTQNFVNLTGSGTLFGIKMEGGDRNVLNCNSVQSAGGNNDGIYAVHAGRASVLCNTTNGPARGLHFEGMLSGRNKADIAGNTMENNSAAGLLLGTDAVVGGQVHRGNKFEGTEAIAGIGAQIHSQFAVDANENPDFLPDAWLPFPWFLNAALPSLSFDCGANTTCPPPPGPTSEYPLDIKIVKGELGGTSYQAANQWLSQRRFYELVAEEGNPYPGNSDVSTFLSQSQTNGLSGYANVQIGIRQLGALSEGARATAAASLLAMNGNLTGSAPYQVNEKTVNNVFLQTVALDNPIFTPAQTALLTSVATQCPLSGGEAVLRARALLNLNFETPIVYNDAICNGQRPSGERNETGIAKGVTLKIYPNPASDRLNLEYSKLENTGDIQLALYDTFGRVVREVALTNKEGKVQLDVQTLPEGIYWYVLPGILTGKVILQH